MTQVYQCDACGKIITGWDKTNMVRIEIGNDRATRHYHDECAPAVILPIRKLLNLPEK